VSTTAFDEEVAPGRLSATARSAATATALDLLGTYFADAPTWQLQHEEHIAPGDAALADLVEAIRLRVGLAAARRLDVLLHAVAARLSFRYARVADESIGAVRGRLDVPRYIQSRARRDVPRRYPIRVLERRHRTPENVLAMYAAGWVRHELINLRTDILPMKSPERTELAERTASLTRTLSHPVLVEAAAVANDVWHRGAREALLDEVQSRLDGGHIAGPEPYQELVDWVRHFDPAATAAGSSVEWSFYDDRFDPKLFEIWILHRLAAAVERKIGPEILRRPLWERGAKPTYTWKLGGASIRMHFQLALSGLREPRWRRTSTGKLFDGIPDVTVILATPLSGEEVVLIDAKLRQRDAPPTEELYKLLGYFHNRGPGRGPYGAIVYYAPGQRVADEYRTADGGLVLALGVDPAREDEDDVAFDRLAELLLTALDELDPVARELAQGSAGADAEEEIARVQEKAVADLLLRAQALATGSLEPYRVMLEAQLPAIWEDLDADIRTILVTAEYFGATAPEGADLSGPLLGLSAACERLLCGSDQVFDRLAKAEPEHVRAPVTLGTAFLIKKARKPREDRDRAVRDFIDNDATIDGAALLGLAGVLLELNEHRRAAAHGEVVLRERWKAGRAVVLGSGDSATPGVLARLVEALRAPQ
jgi:hypothetical protein